MGWLFCQFTLLVWIQPDVCMCVLVCTADINTAWCVYVCVSFWAGVRVCTMYGVNVTFMSTGYMYHEYDLHTGDWMMILISTAMLPFNTKYTIDVCVCVSLPCCCGCWHTLEAGLMEWLSSSLVSIYSRIKHKWFSTLTISSTAKALVRGKIHQ